jgi:methylated-DNA-protein-cysteine methyltransferase-like protein
MPPSFFELVYRVVRCIPPGKVATYGQIARLLGNPRAARTVGWALHSLPEGHKVPWHRVIGARAAITLDPHGGGGSLQRALLEGEGVVFDQRGRVDLDLYAWEGLDPAQRRKLLEGQLD